MKDYTLFCLFLFLPISKFMNLQTLLNNIQKCNINTIPKIVLKNE